MKELIENNAKPYSLYQKVQGEIAWDIYIKLREYSKRKGLKIKHIVGQAILEYLRKVEGEEN